MDRLVEARARDRPPWTRRGRITVDGTPWAYQVHGAGRESLLVLPGVLGGDQILRKLRSGLRERYTLIQPDYPPVGSMRGLVRGVAEILDHEEASPVAVVGASFGAMIAQCLVRRDPRRVERLVLAEALVPQPGRAASHRRALVFTAVLPTGVVRYLLRRAFRRMVRDIPDPVRRRVWIRYYGRLVRQSDRRLIRSRYRAVLDFDAGHRFEPGDLADWPGETLLLEAREDRLADGRDQEILRRLHPRARVHTFGDAGHGAAYLRPREWTRVVVEFCTGR